ncbi:MAG: hypothetical protein H5T86_07255 [Armatimonadetes bacterium]|nr:hypothetical protein [Armatimonadota bacterium]
MAYQARRVVLVKCTGPDAPGLLAQVLRALRDAGVGMISLAGWGHAGQAVLAGVPEDLNKARELAMREGVGIEEHGAIYIEGDNETGALVPVADALAAAGVNLQSAIAVAAGERYGAVLVPDPAHYEAACGALGI